MGVFFLAGGRKLAVCTGGPAWLSLALFSLAGWAGCSQAVLTGLQHLVTKVDLAHLDIAGAPQKYRAWFCPGPPTELDLDFTKICS